MTAIKLNRETAQAIQRLSHTRDFQLFAAYLDDMHQTLITAAVMGVDENFSPDVLRGRAQALSILKNEMEKAGEVAGRIQTVSSN